MSIGVCQPISDCPFFPGYSLFTVFNIADVILMVICHCVHELTEKKNYTFLLPHRPTANNKRANNQFCVRRASSVERRKYWAISCRYWKLVIWWFCIVWLLECGLFHICNHSFIRRSFNAYNKHHSIIIILLRWYTRPSKPNETEQN